jgi:hypothetical protein
LRRRRDGAAKLKALDDGPKEETPIRAVLRRGGSAERVLRPGLLTG